MNPVAGRRLVIVDLENFLGRSPLGATCAEFTSAYRELAQAIDITADDLVIIGINPACVFHARVASPDARLVTRPGPDGADLRLVGELDDVFFVARRFDQVVVASGDRRFVEPVIRLAEAGVRTAVVARHGSMSAALRLAAHDCILLPRNACAEGAA